MNRFENICATCPLRTKVDITRASESENWKAPADVSDLSDGVRTYSVPNPKEEETCHRPRHGILRHKCGIGLASAWRWAEKIGQFKPNITNSDDLLPLLADADYRDAMPHYTDGAWLFGDNRDYSELTHHDPAFTNCGIVKLTATVRGTGAELPVGKAVMLDRISSWVITDETLHDVFRIRVAQGGPQFTFRSQLPSLHTKEPYDENMTRILVDGIYAYLSSDDQSIADSDALLAAAYTSVEQRSRQLNDILGYGSDAFLSGIDHRTS